jgi:hypothetical protein
MVNQKHAKLTEDPAVIQQVMRILREHGLEAGRF